MPFSDQQQFNVLLGVPISFSPSKYLGLPSSIGRHKKEIFRYIVDRTWSSLQGWKRKMISQAGKKALLKVVVQAIPTFLFSVFSQNQSFFKFQALFNYFLWSHLGFFKKGLHLCSWSHLCTHKWSWNPSAS